MTIKTEELFNPYKMFRGIIIPLEILNSNLPTSTKIVYGALLFFAGKKGYCWPKQETLAKFTNITKRRIQYHLDILEKQELIKKENPTGKDKGIHKTNRYFFAYHECFRGAEKNVLKDVRDAEKNVSYNRRERDSQRKRERDTAFLFENIKRKEANSAEFDYVQEEKISKNKNERKTTLISERSSQLFKSSKKEMKPIISDEHPKPLPKYSKVIKEMVDYWNSKSVLRKHTRTDTSTFKNIIFHLRLLLKGKFFESLSVNSKYKNRKFSVDEFKTTVDKFALIVEDLTLFPKNKQYIKRLGISNFLFDVTSSKVESYFLYCFEGKLEKNIVDYFPELTLEIAKLFKEVNGNNYKFSDDQMNRIILASSRLSSFFLKNNQKIKGRYYDNKMKAQVLIESVLKDTQGNTFTPGHLCSNDTFDRRLPQFCEDHIFIS